MYTGIRTDRMSSLAYSSVFCLRRLLMVASLGIFGRNEFFVIVIYLMIHSAHFLYMMDCAPHEENNYNSLEKLADFGLLALLYIMILFIVGSDFDPILQWDAGYLLGAIILIIFSANLGYLIYLNILKIIAFCRKRKEKQKQEALKKA